MPLSCTNTNGSIANGDGLWQWQFCHLLQGKKETTFNLDGVHAGPWIKPIDLGHAVRLLTNVGWNWRSQDAMRLFKGWNLVFKRCIFHAPLAFNPYIFPSRCICIFVHRVVFRRGWWIFNGKKNQFHFEFFKPPFFAGSLVNFAKDLRAFLETCPSVVRNEFQFTKNPSCFPLCLLLLKCQRPKKGQQKGQVQGSTKQWKREGKVGPSPKDKSV